jgi:hypothetical protein
MAAIIEFEHHPAQVLKLVISDSSVNILNLFQNLLRLTLYPYEVLLSESGRYKVSDRSV